MTSFQQGWAVKYNIYNIYTQFKCIKKIHRYYYFSINLIDLRWFHVFEAAVRNSLKLFVLKLNK